MEDEEVFLDVVIFLPGPARPIQFGGTVDAVCDEIDRHAEITRLAVAYNGSTGFITSGDVPREFLLLAAVLNSIVNDYRGRKVAANN